MPARVGTAPVQFFLGANPVSAYLGAAPIARTMYFDGAEDGDWEELGNWWLNSGHTIAAPSLPAAGDSVIATASITTGLGFGVTVVNFTISGTSKILGTNITVTGMATFNDSSQLRAVLTGDATFNDSSKPQIGDFNQAVVSGDATFNDSSQNSGSVGGDATFNDSSTNALNVGGDATFNDSSQNVFGAVTGTATFTGSACNSGGTAGTFVPDPAPTCP